MITLGLDLGGTTFSVGGVDAQGSILLSDEWPTEQHEGPERLLKQLGEATETIRQRWARSNDDGSRLLSPEPISALGIGIPGPVKYRDGICVYAPNLDGWKDLQVAGPLKEQLGLPVFVINDAKAATLGEARYGAGRGVGSILMLTLGTGVGSGITINGQLHTGATDRGTEIGHTTINIEDERGSAGNNGTVESLCGRDAITWRALRHLMSGAPSLIHELCGDDLSTLTPKHIGEAAGRGDSVACAVWRETATYLAAAIVNVILISDVERVVIGGGVAQAGDALFEPLRRAVAARTSRMHFDSSQIVPAQLGPDAGLIGAATWAREQFAGQAQ